MESLIDTKGRRSRSALARRGFACRRSVGSSGIATLIEGDTAKNLIYDVRKPLKVLGAHVSAARFDTGCLRPSVRLDVPESASEQRHFLVNMEI